MKSHSILRITLVATVVLGASGAVRADTPADELLKKPDDWFRSDVGRASVKNVLSWQTAHGDWPKNKDTVSRPFSGEGKKATGTFDNGATTGELRVLARAFRVTGDESCRQAFLRGFDHILEAQYAHGGWPQYFPLSKQYHRHITFNDGTMIRLLEFLRNAESGEDFAFLDAARRDAARAAVKRGIECVVKCQIVVDGTPTVWCAQHHAETLAPVQARSYELPSLSGAESAGILRFLMSLPEPTPEVVRAVRAGAAWFDAAKIEGYRYRRSKTEPALSKDSQARPLWARFYEIESNRPIFSDRDGVA
ncbi:MAG: pectate lyase, partial [Planctomycetales bacterium]|nr:pectate lyase [Planctomycetales bacterium]